MHRLQVLEIALGEGGVEQEGFPYPCLSKEHHEGMTRFETRKERLQGRRMPPTRKERGWTRGGRERVPLQVIKIGLDHGVSPLRALTYMDPPALSRSTRVAPDSDRCRHIAGLAHVGFRGLTHPVHGLSH